MIAGKSGEVSARIGAENDPEWLKNRRIRPNQGYNPVLPDSGVSQRTGPLLSAGRSGNQHLRVLPAPAALLAAGPQEIQPTGRTFQGIERSDRHGRELPRQERDYEAVQGLRAGQAGPSEGGLPGFGTKCQALRG